MTSNTTLITIKLSPEQISALHQLEQVTGRNKSELVREGLDIIGQMHRVNFPQNVAKRGKHDRLKP